MRATSRCSSIRLLCAWLLLILEANISLATFVKLYAHRISDDGKVDIPEQFWRVCISTPLGRNVRLVHPGEKSCNTGFDQLFEADEENVQYDISREEVRRVASENDSSNVRLFKKIDGSGFTLSYMAFTLRNPRYDANGRQLALSANYRAFEENDQVWMPLYMGVARNELAVDDKIFWNSQYDLGGVYRLEYSRGQNSNGLVDWYPDTYSTQGLRLVACPVGSHRKTPYMRMFLFAEERWREKQLKKILQAKKERSDRGLEEETQKPQNLYPDWNKMNCFPIALTASPDQLSHRYDLWWEKHAANIRFEEELENEPSYASRYNLNDYGHMRWPHVWHRDDRRQTHIPRRGRVGTKQHMDRRRVRDYVIPGGDPPSPEDPLWERWRHPDDQGDQPEENESGTSSEEEDDDEDDRDGEGYPELERHPDLASPANAQNINDGQHEEQLGEIEKNLQAEPRDTRTLAQADVNDIYEKLKSSPNSNIGDLQLPPLQRSPSETLSEKAQRREIDDTTTVTDPRTGERLEVSQHAWRRAFMLMNRFLPDIVTQEHVNSIDKMPIPTTGPLELELLVRQAVNAHDRRQYNQPGPTSDDANTTPPQFLPPFNELDKWHGEDWHPGNRERDGEPVDIESYKQYKNPPTQWVPPTLGNNFNLKRARHPLDYPNEEETQLLKKEKLDNNLERVARERRGGWGNEEDEGEDEDTDNEYSDFDNELNEETEQKD